MKKVCKKRDNAGVVLTKQTNDESYERYKKIEYGKLIAKAALFFLLGILVRFLLKSA